MKYHVLYIEDTDSKLKVFDCPDDLADFCRGFNLKHSNDDGSFIQITFFGKMEYKDDTISV